MEQNKKEYTNISLKEMNNLMHVWGVGLELVPKIEEWLDGGGQAQVMEYHRLMKKYYDELYVEPTREGPPRYWFVLLECGAQNWEIFFMHPTETALFHIYEILPKDIIEMMAEDLVDPHTVVKRPKVRSTLLKKNLDLEYVYLSSSCIVGTVMGNTQSIHWKDDPETAFRAFYKYRRNHTDKIRRFTEDFLHRLEADRLPAIKRLHDTTDTAYWEKFRPGWQKWEPAPPYKGSSPLIVEKERGQYEDINIDYLYQLAQIPEFNKWLWLKLEEIKGGPLKKQIDAYNATKTFYRETLLNHRNVETHAANGKRPAYWFIITIYTESIWGVTELDPIPPVFDTPEDILPKKICDIMLRTQVAPACVMSLTSDSTPPLNEKLELQWVRVSPACLMGRIYQSDIDGVKVPGAFYHSPEYMTKLDAMAVSKRLNRHMYRDPAAAVAFMDEFMKELLPKLQ